MITDNIKRIEEHNKLLKRTITKYKKLILNIKVWSVINIIVCIFITLFIIIQLNMFYKIENKFDIIGFLSIVSILIQSVLCIQIMKMNTFGSYELIKNINININVNKKIIELNNEIKSNFNKL
jgi:hypothetical protein